MNDKLEIKNSVLVLKRVYLHLKSHTPVFTERKLF